MTIHTLKSTNVRKPSVFKNLIVYRIGADWSATLAQMEQGLAQARFVECGATQEKSLGWVEPRGQFFFPRCWFHETTGLLCPGCGSTRALHALLHGEWGRAWSLNPLAVIALPAVAGLGVRQVRGVMTGLWWPNPLARGWVLGSLMLGMLAFGIGRNLR